MTNTKSRLDGRDVFQNKTTFLSDKDPTALVCKAVAQGIKTWEHESKLFIFKGREQFYISII